MRITLVHNPGAGDERHTGEGLADELAKAGYEATLRSTRDKELRRLHDDPGDLVIVAGGDGSVKRIAVHLAGRGTPMGILPMGTANNIAKSFGIFGSIRELADGWRDARRARLRVGTAATRWGSMRFVESAGVGVFTELISRGEEEVEQNGAGLTGHEIDRALLLLQRIVAEREPRARRITLDGTDLSGEYLLVEAMNIPRVGPNVPLAPGADPADGQLDLVMVTERERPMLAEYVRARLHGTAAPLELPVRRGARVTIQASPAELHVDDEPWKPGPTRGNRASERGLGEGEVTVALEEVGVEVLVPSVPEAPSRRSSTARR